MRVKRLIIYFIVVSIFLSNSIGITIIHNQIKFFHKKAIKESIKANTFNEVVEILSFSKTGLKNNEYELKFIEKYEFRFNGKLFDIIESWESEDTIFYKCINDTKEEKLEEAFVQYVVNNSKRQDLPLPIKQVINSLIQDLYFISTNFLISPSEISHLKIQHNSSLIEYFSEIPDPPPRI